MRKILIMAGMLLLIMSALMLGYECGKAHVLRDAEMFASGNMIIITIDGDMFEHVAE